MKYICNILTFDPAVNQETGASGRRYRRYHLDRGQVEFGANATLTENNYITRCHRRFRLLGVS